MTPEEIVEFVEGLARIAASRGGAQALAAHLAERLDAGVLVEDSQWRHVAAVGNVGMPSSARVAAAGSKHQTVPIAAGSVRLGFLSAFPGDTRDPGDVIPLLRLTASAIAIELARERPSVNGHRAGFWDALLDRNHHDAAAVRDEAAAHEIAVANHYAVVLLEPDPVEGPDRTAQLAALRNVAEESFRGAQGDTGILERDGTLVIFAPASREIDRENARTAASLLPKVLGRRHPGIRISGGVGTAEPLPAAHLSYQRAAAALAIARRIYGPSHVAAYEELGAYPLLFGDTAVATMREFAAGALAPLRAYDEKHQTELERTLRVYFETGENVKTASAALNVHRHTVFYRLRQIAEITQRRLENPHHQLTLRLALAIDALHAQ